MNRHMLALGIVVLFCSGAVAQEKSHALGESMAFLIGKKQVLVTEVASARKHHGHVFLVASRDDMFIANGATGLNNSPNPRSVSRQDTIIKWEESVGSHHGSFAKCATLFACDIN